MTTEIKYCKYYYKIKYHHFYVNVAYQGLTRNYAPKLQTNYSNYFYFLYFIIVPFIMPLQRYISPAKLACKPRFGFSFLRGFHYNI